MTELFIKEMKYSGLIHWIAPYRKELLKLVVGREEF